MCGLTGLLCPKTDKDIKSYLSKMTSSLVHRGPDDEGIWTEESIGMGHRRLSIIDLSSSGKQPMNSNCGRFVLTFNGEIYNHLDLRVELEKQGHSTNWRGYSDTETLIEAIAHWGLDDALCRTRGMFALAIWDKKQRNLSLARDRIGEKPLYWGWAESDLIFGSELKSLRAHPNCQNGICIDALSQYLRYMYVPSPLSIYEGIFKLEPGTILTVEDIPLLSPPRKPIRPGERYGGISIRRYWNLKTQVETAAKNKIKEDNDAIISLEKTLKEAVESQMISDVPLGAFLSGGVDSSTLVALMQSLKNENVKTFTIGFNEYNYDESNHAEAVANHLGTEHNKLLVTDADARDVIPDLPQLYDEPFADSSQIPTYLICRSARKKVTVAISGDGGDELFGGYNRYVYGPKIWRNISNIPTPLKKLMSFSTQKIPQEVWDRFGDIYNKFRPGSKGISNFGYKVHRLGKKLINSDNFDELYINMISNFIEPNKLIKKDIYEPTSQLQDRLSELGIQDPTMKMMFQDMRTYLPDDILCKVDRASMGTSLETRSPFLDPDVISLSMRLPMHMKIRDSEGKWALRQVLYKYVPKDIIDRPKEGFAIPVGLWLRGPLREWVEDLLSNNNLAKDGMFNSDVILKAWKEHLSGKNDWTNLLWTILMFQSWKVI